jgi:hypothetical protein
MTQKFRFPVVSFRHLEGPKEVGDCRDYYAIVSSSKLPDLSNWREINVRDPKLRGAVPNRIREGISDEPALFVFMNRGLVISADEVRFDNKTNEVVLSLSDPEIHGLLDGGHSYNIILEETTPDRPVHVKMEILTGLSRENITSIVDARNTSNQVKDESLMNLQGEFEGLKKALKGQKFFEEIAWSEYETRDDGVPKAIDVRELISVLMCFDASNFGHSVHPINAYRSKAMALRHFKEHTADFKKLYAIAPELLRLHDAVYMALPDLYNKSRKQSGVVSGGKFGQLTGVTTYSDGKTIKLPYTDAKSTYVVPAGFVFPVLAAFRALLVEKNDRYVWAPGVSPLHMLNNSLWLKLAEVLGNNAREVANPSKTGKSANLWQSLYTEARMRHLELQLDAKNAS